MESPSDAPGSSLTPSVELASYLEQHARLAERIEAFDQRAWLSERERVERKRLQKLKLATKDKIAALRARISELTPTL